MIDPILAEMHKIKEANAKRYSSVEALARSLIEREKVTRADGRLFIVKSARLKAKTRVRTLKKQAVSQLSTRS